MWEKYLIALQKGNKYFLFTALAFFLCASYFFVTYWHFTPDNFGYSLVSVEVPYQNAFFYAKPMTLIVIFSFLSYAFFLEYLEGFLNILNKKLLYVLVVFFFLIAMIYLDEIIWHAIYWSAKAIAINATTNSEFDAITFPPGGELSSKYPSNLIFIDLRAFLYFTISVYSIYFIFRIQNHKSST